MTVVLGGIYACQSQITDEQQDERITYKWASDTALYVHPVFPSKKQPNGSALVFFFGGGWNAGSIEQFRPHAEYFSTLGLTSFLVDYRVASRHETTPFDAVADAKSAIRYVRKHSSEIGVDPEKLIAVGGSAGGHLAAAAAMLSGLNDLQDDITMSPKPNALVLFNPVFDNGPSGYGYERIGDRYQEISPIHNIDSAAPPTLVFFGTNDRLVPVETSLRFQKKMLEVGGRCDLFLYEDQDHGFFNYDKKKYYRETVYQMHIFLHDLGLIDDLPKNHPKSFPLLRAHAHNDYRHKRPLRDALDQGIRSIEVDVLHDDGKLFVGHDREDLQVLPLLTMEELYLNPLYDRFLKWGQIYPNAEEPFLLWIDIKYDGAEVYRLLQEVLRPFESMFRSNNDNPPPVQIILSGDRPIDLLTSDSARYMCVDGRPDNISQEYQPDLMPFISENIRKMVGHMEGDSLNARQFAILENFTRTAHARGYAIRFWNTPDQPQCWKQLLELQVDLINTDKLKAVRSFLISTVNGHH